jgi:hypothetical protein
MGKIWAAVLVWWQGKKTIVGGTLVMAGAVAGVWYGKLDPVTGLTVLGVGLSIAGFSAKANRHQAELLAALQGVAQAGTDLRAGKSAQAIQDAEQTAGAIGYAAAPGILSAAGASLHLSAGSAGDVIALVKSLAPLTTVINNPASPTSDPFHITCGVSGQ